eukprot:CAMPEP_0168524862 /NCGR_PEP_ID=MMETSP0405-20121227/10934_1 /TAXON_ID=498012 /ORGANISM="Trichosphaerium sp, Strain Am-I-7 wt" /LENGTH=226 /DNA_ID=CAMNT_0008547213 /DNA_START=81 /DNA_END=761 /DNA_ORIENTATION=+
MYDSNERQRSEYVESKMVENTAFDAKILQKRMKLHSNKQEREHFDNLANLYSILKTTEALESTYSTPGALDPSEYRIVCAKFIADYESTRKLTRKEEPDIKKFMATYNLNVPLAYERLETAKAPHGAPSDSPKAIAEAVQHFITLMDALKLQIGAVDEIQPLVVELMESLKKLPFIAPDFEAITKLKNWLLVLGKMKAIDELSEEQIRQMSFDLDSSYTAFHKAMQ